MNGFGNQNKPKERANKKINKSIEQIIKQAFYFQSNGKIDEAAKCYKYLVGIGLKDHKLFTNYAILLNSLGKFKEAEIFIRQAIELKPNLIEGHFNLGCILTNLSRFKEAELSTRKVIELKPNHFEAHSNLGSILSKQNQLEEAELSTRKAIELKPNYIIAHINLGEILISQGKLSEGKISLLKAIELNPEFGKSYLHLSRFYSKQKEYKEAFKAISSAIKYDGKNHIVIGEFSRLKNILNSSSNTTTKNITETLMLDNEADEVNVGFSNDQASVQEDFDL